MLDSRGVRREYVLSRFEVAFDDRVQGMALGKVQVVFGRHRVVAPATDPGPYGWGGECDGTPVVTDLCEAKGLSG